MKTNTPAVNPESNTFSTREEYLQFVADWKENYKALSQKIRTTKIDLKTIQRLSHITPTEGQELGLKAAKTRSFANIPSWGYENHRRNLKHEATAMLVARAASKIRAGELRQRDINTRALA